ncbi:type II toxin-antitoxin system VapC family toxin [Larkinella sp. VNQ87]|uniref:type II toxin-antitoxin system VapC family toxin n=1 Tax=Larkinella sp. VNQ87 TaxID=3400921 RepID=UPI003C08A56C
MIYYDTDVLINLLVPQDSAKHQLARELYERATSNDQFLISFLSLQETAFVLHRLGRTPADIEAMLQAFLPFNPVGYGMMEMVRAIELAKTVGFQNINDCLHTAIAESHCEELYTFNRSDFKRIQPLTRLKITLF